MSPAAAPAAIRSFPSAQLFTCEDDAAAAYVDDGSTVVARRHRAGAVARFRAAFGGLDGWAAAPLRKRLAAAGDVRAAAVWLALGTCARVDPAYIAQANVSWGYWLACLEPQLSLRFTSAAAGLGRDDKETERQWCILAKLAAAAGLPAQELDRPHYGEAREALAAAVAARRGRAPEHVHHPAARAVRHPGRARDPR